MNPRKKSLCLELAELESFKLRRKAAVIGGISTSEVAFGRIRQKILIHIYRKTVSNNILGDIKQTGTEP